MSTEVQAFKFNFCAAPSKAAVDGNDSSIGACYAPSSELPVEAPECEELCFGDICEDDPLTFEELPVGHDVSVVKGTVASSTAAGMLGMDEVLDSDLVPGKYEGGFKLWEGGLDLCSYLCNTFGLTQSALYDEVEPETPFKGKRVLELGCGHGLPGIIALMAGAEVHFQDFNKDVLTKLTIPNVVANQKRLPKGRSKGTARFFSGDWQALGEMLANKGFGGHYDFILTAETIYRVESHAKLLECMKQVIQPPQGQIYIAAKSYYFGVGGGIKSFTKLIHADGVLECKRVWRADEGNNTTREVLRLKFPDSIFPYFL